jgi:hypothetical protein
MRKTGRKEEHWDGIVPGVIKYGSHYEIRIESRSGIMVIFGKTSRGGFACVPDFGAGCHLVDLKDRFWNTEQLSGVLGEVDGITVAEALFALAAKGVVL